MLKNYFTTVVRHLFKHKAYSVINVLGLGLGMACFVFIALNIRDESSFDQFHTNEDRLFRINKIVIPQEGDPEHVLRALLSIVLTESTARQLFPDADPVGKSVQGLNNLDYKVTGVARDPSDHSHLDFQAVISWSLSEPGGLGFNWMNRWITQAPFTYVLLATGADVDDLEMKLPDFYEEKDPDRASRYRLYMQPLGDIYLGSANLLYTGSQKAGNIQYVRARPRRGSDPAHCVYQFHKPDHCTRVEQSTRSRRSKIPRSQPDATRMAIPG